MIERCWQLCRRCGCAWDLSALYRGPLPTDRRCERLADDYEVQDRDGTVRPGKPRPCGVVVSDDPAHVEEARRREAGELLQGQTVSLFGRPA